MRKLAQFVARLYPKAWRERYGAEFDCLLHDVTLSWRDVLDVFTGGLKMRVTRSRIALITAVSALFGVAAGGLVGLALPVRFQSSGAIHVQLWSESPVLAAGAVERLASVAFSRKKLKQLIKRYNLYPGDRVKQPLEDVVQTMRNNIQIEPRSGTTFQVSFAYPDRREAQEVTFKLMECLTEANLAQLSRSSDWNSASMVRILALPDRLDSAGLIDVQAASPSPVVKRLTTVAFSREMLKQLIEDYDLYEEDRAERPLEDVIQRMRHDIRVEPRSGTTLQVSFAYPHRHKAQQVTLKLMDDFFKANLTERLRSINPKLSYTLRVTPADMPELPQTPSNPSRVKLMSAGLVGGLLLGLSISLLRHSLCQGA